MWGGGGGGFCYGRGIIAMVYVHAGETACVPALAWTASSARKDTPSHIGSFTPFSRPKTYFNNSNTDYS